ncbi:hypothetical protein [Anabaena catenula]|uniref:Uncharacterized protein n=1 Tax=Anabaena catenula FACHB-362 TaxID=2692877 RepID=A0ABR8J2S0_9NOST|nr:hypothetical protein [Anabaena catenula]MBD2691759.1 hypothetical protein [Anabaena catenula FACHB-362]
MKSWHFKAKVSKIYLELGSVYPRSVPDTSQPIHVRYKIFMPLHQIHCNYLEDEDSMN